MHSSLVKSAKFAIPLYAVPAATREAALRALGPRIEQWAQSADFRARNGEILPLTGDDGRVAAILFGLGRNDDPLAPAAAAENLPAGTYRLPAAPSGTGLVALGWLLGT